MILCLILNYDALPSLSPHSNPEYGLLSIFNQTCSKSFSNDNPGPCFISKGSSVNHSVPKDWSTKRDNSPIPGSDYGLGRTNHQSLRENPSFLWNPTGYTSHLGQANSMDPIFLPTSALRQISDLISGYHHSSNH